MGHRSAGCGCRFDSPREEDVRLGGRSLRDRIEVGLEETLARSCSIKVSGSNGEVIDDPCAEVLLERGRDGAGEGVVVDAHTVDQAASLQGAGGHSASDPAVGSAAAQPSAGLGKCRQRATRVGGGGGDGMIGRVDRLPRDVDGAARFADLAGRQASPSSGVVRLGDPNRQRCPDFDDVSRGGLGFEDERIDGRSGQLGARHCRAKRRGRSGSLTVGPCECRGSLGEPLLLDLSFGSGLGRGQAQPVGLAFEHLPGVLLVATLDAGERRGGCRDLGGDRIDVGDGDTALRNRGAEPVSESSLETLTTLHLNSSFLKSPSGGVTSGARLIKAATGNLRPVRRTRRRPRRPLRSVQARAPGAAERA